jgi:hypothetical protein
MVKHIGGFMAKKAAKRKVKKPAIKKKAKKVIKKLVKPVAKKKKIVPKAKKKVTKAKRTVVRKVLAPLGAAADMVTEVVATTVGVISEVVHPTHAGEEPPSGN